MIRTIKYVGYFLTAILSIAGLLFSLFYLLHDYEYLAGWYTSLNPCFYRSAQWQQDFFTPEVKSTANLLHAIAIVICAILLLVVVRRILKARVDLAPTHIDISRSDWAGHILLTLVGFLMWSFSHGATHPAYDEIFSAVNCAGIHPFQTLSYYMLPNNHLLFNWLNAIFSFGMEDKVLSGRLISLLAFVTSLHLGYLLLKEKMSAMAAFITILVLSLSLPILGFASQARGYSFQLMAGWCCVLSLFHYLRFRSSMSLWGLVAGIFIGFAALPGFLYFGLTLIAFIAVVQIYDRKFDFLLWKYFLIAGGILFLFYLPAFSFSGISAFTDNSYVKVGELPLREFFPQFTGLFYFFMNYGFSGFFDPSNPILYILFLAPLLLIFSGSKQQKGIAVYYILMWASVIIVVLLMKKIPFTRNLIVQYHVGLAIIAYTLYAFLTFLVRWKKWKAMKPIIYYSCLIGLGVILGTRFSDLAGEQLYFNPANSLYEQHSKDILNLEKDSTIAFSDESFYWYYLCKQSGFTKINQCPEGNEAFIVKRFSESLPDNIQMNYQSVMKFEADSYEILKRMQ